MVDFVSKKQQIKASSGDSMTTKHMYNCKLRRICSPLRLKFVKLILDMTQRKFYFLGWVNLES